MGMRDTTRPDPCGAMLLASRGVPYDISHHSTTTQPNCTAGARCNTRLSNGTAPLSTTQRDATPSGSRLLLRTYDRLPRALRPLGLAIFFLPFFALTFLAFFASFCSLWMMAQVVGHLRAEDMNLMAREMPDSQCV